MSADRIRLDAEFKNTFSCPPTLVSSAPGRVNLIGEHTDYNDGLVLPAAIDRTVAVAAAPREDGIVRARSLEFDQRDEFPAAGVRRFRGSRGWRDYVRGVAWALLDEHVPVRGADLLIAGDVPVGAGLSSSAALELAVAGAFTRLSGTTIDDTDLALICQTAENVFVGVQCGIMDQMASSLGVKDYALLIDCRNLTWQAVPLPPEIAIVVIDSGVQRSLAETPYNERRKECADAADALGVKSLRDLDEDSLENRRSALPGSLYRRAHHVVSENARVRAMVSAMESSDLHAMGRLMHESHESLRDDFQASTPELDMLVGLAEGVDGVIGARLTGAGFGGCTVNLVREECVPQFQSAVVDEYRRRTGLAAAMHELHASDGLRVTSV